MDPRILQPPPGQKFEVWQKKRMTFISLELSRKGCNFFVSKMLVFPLTLAKIIKDSSGVSLHHRQPIGDGISIHFSEEEGAYSFCAHADPTLLFPSQASTKFQGPESQFGTRILGFYVLTM